jgi:hypothetical protein
VGPKGTTACGPTGLAVATTSNGSMCFG